MNLLVVTQYFWPENFLINNLTKGLVERGHNVTVLTGSPNYPHGKFFDGYGYFNQQQEYYGVKVLRVPLVPRGTGKGLRLILNYFSFALSATLFGPLLCKGKFDAIFVFEPSPITIGIPAIILKSIKVAPILFWVQDLWPESLAATGAVKSKYLLLLIGKLVKFIYKRCDKVLIQSKAFLDSVVQQGGNPDDIFYFPNSAESVFDVMLPATENPQLSRGEFKIMFAGNIGAAQDFGTIIAVAKMLQSYKDIHWIIAGDGRMKEWAETEVMHRGLSGNFHFIGQHAVEAMPALLIKADALLVTLKKEPIFALTVPSKIQSYLACGKPIIAALDGEGASIIEESGAGFACPAEDPDAFAHAVLKMYKISNDERLKMGIRGREYYETNFDRNTLLDKLDLWMKDLVDASKEKLAS